MDLSLTPLLGMYKSCNPGHPVLLCSPPAVPHGQGRKGRSMACGKFGSAQTLLWLQLLQNLMNVPRDVPWPLSQATSTLEVQDEKTFEQP